MENDSLTDTDRSKIESEVDELMGSDPLGFGKPNFLDDEERRRFRAGLVKIFEDELSAARREPRKWAARYARRLRMHGFRASARMFTNLIRHHIPK